MGQRLESQPPFDFVFFDQRGSGYKADLEVLERDGLLAEGAIIVADNVLKPGAPAYLWHVLCGGGYDTKIVRGLALS